MEIYGILTEALQLVLIYAWKWLKTSICWQFNFVVQQTREIYQFKCSTSNNDSTVCI